MFTVPVLQELPDGSYLSRLRGSRPISVRVIEYTIDDGRGAEGEHYRLVTTLLDPEQVPALEFADLYAQRWEFETTLDELKTHRRGAKVVLLSPDGVQEVWAFLLARHTGPSANSCTSRRCTEMWTPGALRSCAHSGWFGAP